MLDKLTSLDVINLSRPAFTWSAHVKYNLGAIEYQNCSHYVLQEQSMFLSRDDYFSRSYSLPYARIITNTIRKKNPNAKVFLFETWGYRYGYFHGDTFENMSRRIRRGYGIVARGTNTTIIHSQEWFFMHQNITPLFRYDGKHPSLITSKAISHMIVSQTGIKKEKPRRNRRRRRRRRKHVNKP